MSVTKVSVLVMLLVVAFVAYRYFSTTQETLVTTVPEVEEPLSEPVPTLPEMDNQPVAQAVEAAAPIAEPECLTPEEAQSHPLIMEFRKHRAAVATDGVDVEKFRGIDEATVRNYAEQGDSAAMVVVGAMAVIRAQESDSSGAVDWLSDHDDLDYAAASQNQISPEAGLALNDAAYWFYEAALHGRTDALRHYGIVRGKLFGGAVGLGWISQEEWDAMDYRQQQELWPLNVYHNVAVDLMPRPEDGIVRSSLRTESKSEIATEIRSNVHNEFNMAIEDAGLPPPATSFGDFAEYKELEARFCRSE